MSFGGGWKDCSVVKNMFCLGRGFKFSSQHSQRAGHNCLSPQLQGPNTLSGLHHLQTHTCTYPQTETYTYIHNWKEKKFLKKKTHLVHIDKLLPNFICQSKEPRITNTTEEEQSRDHHYSNSKLTVMEQNRKPRNKPKQTGQSEPWLRGKGNSMEQSNNYKKKKLFSKWAEYNGIRAL